MSCNEGFVNIPAESVNRLTLIDDETLTLTFQDENGDPVDISAKTFTLTIAGSLTLSEPFGLSKPDDSTLIINLSADAKAGLPKNKALSWVLKSLDGGITETWDKGTVTFV